MAGEFLLTIGSVEGLSQINGPFLKGRREPRIAVVGRSNVGKSSLINAILGTRLARVSNQPGKTRNLHFYIWKEGRKIITDLPGYGYARASHVERDRWAEFIRAYFDADEGLHAVLLLLDSRHGPTDNDREAIQFLSSLNIPVTFIMTKTDTLKNQSERALRKKQVAEVLQGMGFDPSQAFWVSAKTKEGLKPLLDSIREIGKQES